MHLISPLICGVQNAGNGTASVYRRGTTTPATLYSSFEGGTFASSSLDSNDRVILDSYGRAEVYVNDLVDVSVYDSGGTLQISFTAGYAASGIEVRSPSFTGTAYDMTSVNTAGQPTTLQAVLDSWYTLRSLTNWGLPNSSLPFVVVTDTAYGAVGNGVTDDRVAIQTAITAAGNGGIVFFPLGTYRVTQAISVAHTNVLLLGVGAEGTSAVSKLLIDDSSESLITTGASNTKLTLTALRLESAQANSSDLIDTTDSTVHTLVLNDCVVGDTVNGYSDGDLVVVSAGHAVHATRCEFTLGGSTSEAITCSGSPGEVYLSWCTFRMVGITAYSGQGFITGNNIYADNCTFSVSHTSGTLTCVRFNTGVGTMNGGIRGCNFTVPNSGTGDVIGMDLATPDASSTFIESGNKFPTATQYDTRAFTAYAYGGTFSKSIKLHTRELRVIRIADNSSPLEIPTDQYGVIIVASTNTAAELDATLPPEGSTGTVFFYHPSGGAGTAVVDRHFFGDTSATTADTSTHCWQYVTCLVNATMRLMVTVDAKALGNGA